MSFLPWYMSLSHNLWEEAYFPTTKLEINYHVLYLLVTTKYLEFCHMPERRGLTFFKFKTHSNKVTN